MSGPNQLPLAGVRVLDLSRILAGPWATQLLADYGAEVFKIERPEVGDDTRGWGPPYVATGDAAYFYSANRNKKSVAIDIATESGAALVRELARSCDVFVENFKLGGLAQYGLDYTSLSALNPKIVYCSITGFGQTGPNSNRPGYDYLIQAMAGLMSVTGQADGQPGSEPLKVGVAVSDLFTGLYAANAIQAALRQVELTGQGCHLDAALYDCQIAALANQAMNFITTDRSPQRLGNAHPSIVPYQVFEVADGHIVIAVGNDSQFQDFCAGIERPDLGAIEKWRTNRGRVEDRAALITELVPILLKRSGEEWIDILEANGVPCGPIQSIGEAINSPQTVAREQVIDHSNGLRTIGQPIPFPGQPTNAPPSLGAHTQAVLRNNLGLNGTEIAALQEKGAVG